MNAAIMLIAALSSTLVLRSGDRIDVDGPVRQANGQVIFRSLSGTLYSLPANEIDEEATRTLTVTAPVELSPPESDQRPLPVVKLRVSEAERDRLLRQLEQNHTGKPAPRQALLDNPPPPPTRAERLASSDEEWSWRTQARHHEETIRQNEEALALLQDRVSRLQGEIRALLSLGFRPRQFTYQSSLLASTLEQIPYAELSVTRAKRAYEQFRDDARRLDVMPGWLR